MVRPKPEEIEELLQQQELDSDGSESASGSNPVPGEDHTADTEEMIKDVTGNEPEDEFNLGDEVNKDEVAIRDKEIDDYEDDDEEDEGELDKIERKENVTEDAASDDPYETLGEDDDLDPVEEE